MQLAEKWRAIIEDPVLQVLEDLPYKSETDKWGNLLMSPAANYHGRLQIKLAHSCLIQCQQAKLSASVRLKPRRA